MYMRLAEGYMQAEIPIFSYGGCPCPHEKDKSSRKLVSGLLAGLPAFAGFGLPSKIVVMAQRTGQSKDLVADREEG